MQVTVLSRCLGGDLNHFSEAEHLSPGVEVTVKLHNLAPTNLSCVTSGIYTTSFKFVSDFRYGSHDVMIIANLPGAGVGFRRFASVRGRR